jgi:2-(1,2-epoxy-1,2-dihydrophenyl)acetyl-CoA isomerase
MNETSPAPVAYTVESGVATITLDRPTASNALNRAMKEQLLHALSAAKNDDSVRAVALLAAGRNFCVGQDLGEHVEALRADPSHAMDTVREHYNPLVRALHDIEVPVVAGITGACVGAGLGLALATDIRIAGTRAKFGTAFTGIGLASDSALSASLTEVVGKSRATALFLLGDTVDADTAHTWGIVHRPAGRRSHRRLLRGQGTHRRKHRRRPGHRPGARSRCPAATRRLCRPQRRGRSVSGQTAPGLRRSLSRHHL